jgi:hypothetical protein
MPVSGLRSMMRSTWAQPIAERTTRNRPEMTATDWPSARQPAMAARIV